MLLETVAKLDSHVGLEGHPTDHARVGMLERELDRHVDQQPAKPKGYQLAGFSIFVPSRRMIGLGN